MRLYWQDLRLNVSYSVPQLRHRCINVCTSIKIKIEYNIGNGQLSDVTGSVHVMGRYLANAIVSDKSK